jgi:hypothetical protein
VRPRRRGCTAPPTRSRRSVLRSETLVPVDLRPPASRERVVIHGVRARCYVAVETNRYPVPFTWVGRDIEVQLLAAEVIPRSTSDEPARTAVTR